MARKRTSPIWTIDCVKLSQVVQNNDSFSEILRYFGLCPSNGGGRFRDLKKRLRLDGIDYSHINSSNKGKIFRSLVPLEKILVSNSTYSRGHLKTRLIKNNLLKNECVICRQTATWNSKKLVLVLDHINGIRNDNRIKNLRLLCPNCNSQQDTFAGRKNKKPKKFYYCLKCNEERSSKSKSKLCYICSQKSGSRLKVKNRPDMDILQKQVQQFGFCGTGKKYEVSDNCIRKWLKG